MKVGCGPSDLLTDQQREDKLVYLQRNKYYGHPNPKRAKLDNDSRQCVWRNPTEPASLNFEPPLGVVLSSTTGVIEYKADHFNGQLRGNLIHVKYKFGLFRTVLSSDGVSANPLTIPGIALIGRNGLDVTQAPNGNLIEVRYTNSTLWVNSPVEPPTSVLKVNSVFPSRGGTAGGTLLRIYGLNFDTLPTVLVGGKSCPIVGISTSTYIVCQLPGGTGLVNVMVTSPAGTYTFKSGYRYITGK
jgi:hypothetical protein